MTYTFDNNIISDLHKDARGYRPSQGFWEGWNTMGDDTKQSVWDMLIEELNESMEMEKIQEEQALITFRKLVRKTMDLCSCKWNDAIRMLCDTYGQDYKCDQDLMHFLWSHDIGYQDRQKIFKLFREAS